MSDSSPFKPPLIETRAGNRLKWGGLQSGALSLTIANTARFAEEILVVVMPDTLSCLRLLDELLFFLGTETQIPVIHFPDRETLPYDVFSPHQDIISERLLTLYRMPTLTSGIILVSCATLTQRLLPQDFLNSVSFVVDCDEKLDLKLLKHKLSNSGYQSVSQVMEHGEFCARGSIIDIFPMGAKQPYRIDLFDDLVDSIRLFDPESQRSLEKIENIRLLPAKEYPLTEEAITRFRQNWRARFQGNPANAAVYQNISKGLSSGGIEYYLPLFYEDTQTFFDYLPNSSIILKCGNIEEATDTFQSEVNERYEQYRHDQTRPLLPPNELFLQTNELFSFFKNYTQVQIVKNQVTTGVGRYHFNCPILEDLKIERNEKIPLNKLDNFITNTNLRFLFCTESIGRRESLFELLKTINVVPTKYDSWNDFLASKDPIGIVVSPLEQSVQLTAAKIALITESQLFGEQVTQKRRRSTTKKGRTLDSVVRNLVELNIGDPVVHLDHGVGRYLGLQTLNIDENEFLILQYAGEDKLYLPVSSLHLIGRYSGPNEEPPLHKLGGDKWQKAKSKASEKIRDVAAELLEIYAKRDAKKGYSFKLHKENYLTFASAFPFEETPDQENAINDVMHDMNSSKMMDRLICGDVGFGKTEVAMRATFISSENNKQVAILTPTTLLAQQHYQTFRDRFANWPINIEVLSRFRSNKEQKKILEDLEAGKVDVIIGTHRLLQKDIKFRELGLLIIDEEHRFGVTQKEKIKSFRSDVDILTLTATPIPRTLNMSLSGIRDLSIISTPPAKRLSIKTFVIERSDDMVREAILRETLRGGQVYYLHNNVQMIDQTAERLQKIVPEVNIQIAHGQMPEKELEQIMTDFYHHRFNVLLCTTIIESGIDIPTANTMIIERADKFGLAQLHQLRGRVGRSHHQAYTYLMIPSKKLITPDATKRLDVIANLEDLGAGFLLATHDLEIRGAGELLGAEQSGHIQAIGFSLYMELLERTVKALRAGEKVNLDEPLIEVNIHVTALIPEKYINDVHLRLIFYKRIADAKDASKLRELQIEMIDRFGLLPQPIKNLFDITQIKIIAKNLGILKLEATTKSGKIQFNDKPNINPTKLIGLIQDNPKKYRLHGSNGLRFYFEEDIGNEVLIQHVEDLLLELKK